jgi:hypothetical protein
MVDFHGETLQSMNAIYSPVAIIINFFMQFTDKLDLLGYVLQLFKRLYNIFPSFRKNLEDPILSCLFNTLRQFKKNKNIVMKHLNVQTDE